MSSNNNNSNNFNGNNKKLKKEGSSGDFTREKEEIEIMRRHILSFQDLPGSSVAMKASLDGLEKELQRIKRDEKLKEKFSKTKKEDEVYSSQHKIDETETEIVDWKKERGQDNTSKSNQMDDSIMMEWQDITPPSSEIAPGSNFEESILGKKLAEVAISKIAAVDAKVSDDLSALALVIHSALLSDLLNFKCTGVPEPDSGGNKNNGFAKPIRELPRNKFLPDEFYSATDRNTLQLRYRKKDTGSVVLKLSKVKTPSETNISIEFTPTVTRPEPNPQGPLEFSITEHFNLDSFYTALDSAQKLNLSSQSTKILPTLHFKKLPLLLRNFVSIFDIGPVNEPSLEPNTGNARNNETSAPQPISASHQIHVSDPIYYNTGQNFIPQRVYGDFDTDLEPNGLFVQPPLRTQTGNLMGPNHSIFHQPNHANPDDIGFEHPDDDPFNPMIGGLGMRPRFDPYGPPGGPTDLRRNGGVRGRGRGGPRRGRGMNGGPNPDHQRPPSDDMFM